MPDASKQEISKSDKFAKAVARVTEIDVSKPPKSAEAMIKPFTPDQMEADLATGKYEAAPQIVRLAQGTVIEGLLEGHGPDAEFTDATTGEVTIVKTWIIADPTRTVRVSILSSVQLDRKLNGFIGSHVKIARGPDVNVGGGKRMTEYLVYGERLPNGRMRQWFDVTDETRMLAAGAAIDAAKEDLTA